VKTIENIAPGQQVPSQVAISRPTISAVTLCKIVGLPLSACVLAYTAMAVGIHVFTLVAESFF
jgi:hypothetical protein